MVNPNPMIYHKRRVSTSCLNLERFVPLDMDPMVPCHRRSSSDQLPFITTNMDSDQTATKFQFQGNINKIASSSVPSTENPTSGTRKIKAEDLANKRNPLCRMLERRVYVERELIQLKTMHNDNIRRNIIKAEDALRKDIEELNYVERIHLEVKRQLDALVYIFKTLNKGK